MARIYKQRYTVLNKKTGQRETRQTKNWYIEFRDPSGKLVVKPGYRDKLATAQYAAELERTAERVDAGLLSVGVEHGRTPIAQHIDDYVESLRTKGDTAKHVSIIRRQLERLTAGSGWTRIADMDQSGVLAYLARCRNGKGPTAEGRTPARMSRETANHYVRAARAFGTWLVGQRRTALNPFAGMAILNPEVDRRRVRRVLSEGEFGKLLAAANVAPRRCQMSGPDRAILYLLAAYSGLRLGELASLAPHHLCLTDPTPHVVIDAVDSKSGQRAEIPLPVDVVKRLAKWMKGRTVVFHPGPWTAHAARMLRGDLKAAGIPFADERGRVFDFHSLRSQYATNLARAGVDLRVAQRLMRHSSPVLTAKHYTRLELTDLAAEVAKLPTPPK